MNTLLRTGIIIAALMMAASAAAVALRPTHKLADAGPKVDLEAMIPKQFGDWRIDDTIRPVLPSPDVQDKLDKIYNQTLARTYINSRGQRIMLSIAYGGDQSDSMQVHQPEVCYPAQGFQVRKSSLGQLATNHGALPVKRLVATQGSRIEPITYWITVGDEVINAGYKQKTRAAQARPDRQRARRHAGARFVDRSRREQRLRAAGKLSSRDAERNAAG